MYGLTQRQADVKRWIADYLQIHGGVGPSLQEIADAFGYQAPASAHKVVVQLERKGHIERIPASGRSIRIVPARREG